MRRGDVVTVAPPRDDGKPRPAVVVQSDRLAGTGSVIVCPTTTYLRDAPLFRLPVQARPENGLLHDSQIVVDKVQSLKRERVGSRIGQVDRATMARLGELLAVCLDLGE